MSRIEVVMPQMGESIAEGTIVKWHKKVGEKVKKDETLLEISTDKVDSEIPSPGDLHIDDAPYLNGVGDAIGELRRHVLDLVRNGRPEEGEQYLDTMDEFYTELMSFDYPDAITHGLRKKTDVARSLIERTRGDLTTALQIRDLKDAMGQLEKQLKR